jgi:DNA-binding FadR family transcriptional regulator
MSVADLPSARGSGPASLRVSGGDLGLDTSARSSPFKASERIARAILADAEQQHLRPGDQLPSEAWMARAYQVGRISIREALRILEVHGVVEIHKGRGHGPRLERLKARSVATTLRLYLQIRHATYGDVLDAREAVAPVLAARAAQRATLQERKALRQQGEELRQADKADPDQVGARMMRFWVDVGSAAHNPSLAMFYHALADIQSLRTSPWYRNQEYWKVHCAEAARVAAAIADRDPEGARAAAEKKIRLEARFARKAFPRVLEEVVTWD